MVDPHEVPDDVLAVLFEHMPEDQHHARANHSDDWRLALSHVLTRWERGKPYDQDAGLPADLLRVHEHTWRVIGVKSAKIVYIAQTFVLQDCRVCGELKATQLQGEWTLAEITEGKQT